MVDAVLAGAIEHTLLKTDATLTQIQAACAAARTWGCAGVCVQGRFVPAVSQALAGQPTKTVAVVGFPLAGVAPLVRLFEAQQARADGADELDMVLPLAPFLAQEYAAVVEEIAAVVAAVAPLPVKVIIETGLLSQAQKETAAACVVKGKAAYLKTCSGFAGGGASVADVALFARLLPSSVAIKASGGIANAQAAHALLAAGAQRLGCSQTAQILGAAAPAATPGGY